jgi:hypothetical protein
MSHASREAQLLHHPETSTQLKTNRRRARAAVRMPKLRNYFNNRTDCEFCFYEPKTATLLASDASETFCVSMLSIQSRLFADARQDLPG